MKRTWFLLVPALGLILGCGGVSEKPGSNVVSTSQHEETYSHHTGENCVSCHRQGGEGRGWFTVSGSVYEPNLTVVNPNTTLRLFTGPGATGELKGTIEVDGLGNFFTTEPIDFEGGLYPVLYGNDIRYKALSTRSGACSLCHGVSVDRLFVE